MTYRLTFSEYRFGKNELVEIIRSQGFEILETVINDYRLDQNDYGIGFYTDWPFLRNRNEAWRFNRVGKLCFRTLKWISPYLVASGILIVAKNKK